ncbi:immunoglobulin-like domain-containing protein [Plantibacter sp. YIM 135347]|uniref:immunoglobulin-like domain-containing protein n=1 Tax=Plantibacter sp. YIM 135347 TaxID=3423919 RepID=UPI003D32AC08
MTPSSDAPGSFTRRQALVLLGSAAAASAVVLSDPFGRNIAQAAEATAIPLLSTATTTWRYSDANADPAAGNADLLVWAKAGYDDASWKSGKGGFGAKRGLATGMGGGYAINTLLTQYVAGSTSEDIPTYFFRTTFELTAQQLAQVQALSGSAVYDDAFTIYVNGQKAAGFSDAAIDPTKNLQFSGTSVSDPQVAAFTVAKTLLREGTNTVAVALYQGDAGSSDIYFDLTSLTATTTSVAAQVSDVVLNIGADVTQLNLAWYTTSGIAEVAQLTTAGGSFDTATSFPASGAKSTDGQEYRHATLTGLAPDTAYSYRVGSAEGVWSDTFSFSTRAFTGDFSFLLIGDSQIGASGNATNDAAGWATTLQKAETLLPESRFVLSVGDQVDSAANETQYAGFLAPKQLTKTPLITNIGNHDVASLAYRQHFNMPNIDETFGQGNAGQSGGNYWFVYNDVLFISFNSNNRENARHVEYVAKIVTEQGAGKKWIVVHFHHSIFSVASHATDADIIERRGVFPAGFSEIGVDLVVMGHDHVYTRSYLMNGNQSVAQQAKGTVVPKDGDVLYLTANSSSGSKFYEIQEGQDFFWADVENQEHIPNMTNVQVTDDAITLTTYRVSDLTVVDEVRLEKPDTVAPVITAPASTTLTVGDSFDPMAGVTAADARDGDLTSKITVAGAVDPSKAGKTTLTYSVSDAAGNAASVDRVVTVNARGVVTPTPSPGAGAGTGAGAPAGGKGGKDLASTGVNAGGFVAAAAAALAAGGALIAGKRLSKRAPSSAADRAGSDASV